MTLRLSPAEHDLLVRVANTLGRAPATLARELVVAGAVHGVSISPNAARNGDGTIEGRSHVRISQYANGFAAIEVKAYVGDDQALLEGSRDAALAVYRSTLARLAVVAWDPSRLTASEEALTRDSGRPPR